MKLDHLSKSELLEFLSNVSSPQEILAFQPPLELQLRVSELLEKNRAGRLAEADEREWAGYEEPEHLVRIVKVKAFIRLRAS